MWGFILTLGMDSRCLSIAIASGNQNCDISALGANLGQIRASTSYFSIPHKTLKNVKNYDKSMIFQKYDTLLLFTVRKPLSR